MPTSGPSGASECRSATWPPSSTGGWCSGGGDRLFPDGDHGVDDVQGIAASPYDRRMDDTKYYDLPVILEKLSEGIRLAQRVLDERNGRIPTR